jgi:large subunit ribosomal protein L32
MVVRMRHTRAHTANRRSHHALTGGRFSKCPDCGALRLPHHACPSCGKYNGRMVVDVAAKIAKKNAKIKKKAATETTSRAKES